MVIQVQMFQDDVACGAYMIFDENGLLLEKVYLRMMKTEQQFLMIKWS